MRGLSPQPGVDDDATQAAAGSTARIEAVGRRREVNNGAEWGTWQDYDPAAPTEPNRTPTLNPA